MPDTRMVVIRWQTDRGMLERAANWPDDRSLQEVAEEQVHYMLKAGILPIRPLRGITCIVPVVGRDALWPLATEKKRFPVQLIREVVRAPEA